MSKPDFNHRRSGSAMTLSPEETPFPTFERWLADAMAREPDVPTAAALATADAQGRPSVRMVLLKDWGAAGFVFYTNLESRKAGELGDNPHAALCVHWKSLKKQVRIEGSVTQVGDEEADAYFATRDRKSRIGAWASRQSAPLESPRALEKAVARHGAKFAVGDVPRPPYWSGFRLMADMVEFWDHGRFRLHRRLRYDRSGETWTATPLYP